MPGPIAREILGKIQVKFGTRQDNSIYESFGIQTRGVSQAIIVMIENVTKDAIIDVGYAIKQANSVLYILANFVF